MSQFPFAACEKPDVDIVDMVDQAVNKNNKLDAIIQMSQPDKLPV